MLTLRKQRESSCSHLVMVLDKVKVVQNFLNCLICLTPSHTSSNFYLKVTGLSKFKACTEVSICCHIHTGHNHCYTDQIKYRRSFLSVFRWTETRNKHSKYDTCLFRGMFGKYTLISTTPKYLTSRLLNQRKG